MYTRWSQQADKMPSSFHKLFSTGRKDEIFFPRRLLLQMSMLMSSEYPLVHFDECVTSLLVCIFRGSQEKRQDSPIAQIALFVFPTLTGRNSNT